MINRTDPLRRRRVAIGGLAWLAFAACWWLVLRHDPKAWREEMVLPLGALLAVTVVTLAWVRHNLGIYRRKGPRRGLPEADTPWRRDSLGRPLDLPAAAFGARVVSLSIADGVKRYEVQR